METITQKLKKTFEMLKEKSGYTNVMQSPRLEKIVVNVGTGSFRDNKDKIAVVEDRLKKITGQSPAPRPARKSIATFKLREGESIGFQVTLRGERMKSFLDKLVHIALPRMKDFRGISKKGIDDMGNYTLGISEHTIFPETSDEDLRNVFGLSITLVTSAKTKEEAETFLTYLGLPFRD